MREILRKISFDPFHRRIEITEFQIREFIPDLLHHKFNAHVFARICMPDLSKVPVGVDIEIPPLDHLQAGFTYEFAQRFVFFNTVCHPRKYKIIEGCPSAKAVHHFNTFNDIFKYVIIGAIIFFVNMFSGAVGTHPDGIQPCFAKNFYGIRL